MKNETQITPRNSQKAEKKILISFIIIRCYHDTRKKYPSLAKDACFKSFCLFTKNYKQMLVAVDISVETQFCPGCKSLQRPKTVAYNVGVFGGRASARISFLIAAAMLDLQNLSELVLKSKMAAIAFARPKKKIRRFAGY